MSQPGGGCGRILPQVTGRTTRLWGAVPWANALLLAFAAIEGLTGFLGLASRDTAGASVLW